MLNNLKYKKGFSLIEFMLVMVAILIASALIVPKFLEARDTSQGREEAGKVTELKTRIEAYYAQEPDFSGLDSAFSGIAPRTFSKNSSDQVINMWRKVIKVAPATHGTSAGYTITYEGVPRGTVCNEFIKTSKANFWNEMKVGTVTLNQDSNIADIMKACRVVKGKKNTSTEVVFTYWNI
ncbi:pilin [Photobacterium kishitanii]|uniref:Type 4 secretion system PilS N-terminal domain-containing protein n=1 Tax=Photobacterium kishitanii TaxID=318456 RepID=A0A2T3KN28_9GAMM|nr:type 4 pilus major pilin [Photobacterium kishitanii]PSV01206.1 hypothetical protein C9J27_03920 [Photobacterium kishitanii]